MGAAIVAVAMATTAALANEGFSSRREEALRWFREHQFGVTPVGRLPDERIGERSVSFEKSGIKIDITCVLPEGASAEKPVPVFLFGDHMSEHKPPFENLEYQGIPRRTWATTATKVRTSLRPSTGRSSWTSLTPAFRLLLCSQDNDNRKV